MPSPKLSKTKTGKNLHYSVGAVIKKNGKYLLIDRAKPPYGYACLSGHIDEGESETEALAREVREESGLIVTSHSLLYEEQLDWNWCGRGVGIHYVYIFECEVSGEIVRNQEETKSISWYETSVIKTLSLEPVWGDWFKKLGVI